MIGELNIREVSYWDVAKLMWKRPFTKRENPNGTYSYIFEDCEILVQPIPGKDAIYLQQMKRREEDHEESGNRSKETSNVRQSAPAESVGRDSQGADGED